MSPTTPPQSQNHATGKRSHHNGTPRDVSTKAHPDLDGADKTCTQTYTQHTHRASSASCLDGVCVVMQHSQFPGDLVLRICKHIAHHTQRGHRYCTDSLTTLYGHSRMELDLAREKTPNNPTHGPHPPHLTTAWRMPPAGTTSALQALWLPSICTQQTTPTCAATGCSTLPFPNNTALLNNNKCQNQPE